MVVSYHFQSIIWAQQSHIISFRAGTDQLQPVSHIWPPLGFVKFYWNTATLVCLYIVNGCFLSTTPELSNWGRDHMAHKASNVFYLVLYRKSVPIPVERTVPITSACLREEKHKNRIKFSLWPYSSQQPLDLGWYSHHVLQMRKLRYRGVKWHSQKVPKPRPKPGQAGFIRLASSYWVG